MVHELTKTIRIFFDRETVSDNSTDNVQVSVENRDKIVLYLNSSAHCTQFLDHFLDQGKILNDIAYKMLSYNSSTLEDVMT